MPITQPSTSITYDDAIELAERQPPHFSPPKQPPPDRDTIGVGPTTEGFAALQRVLKGATYCLPHLRGCQRGHNISREGVLDIGYLLHPGKVLDAGYSPYIADSHGRDPDKYAAGAPARHREACRAARRTSWRASGGSKPLSSPDPSTGDYLPPKPTASGRSNHGGRATATSGAHNIVTP